jgi:hypothetical protein
MTNVDVFLLECGGEPDDSTQTTTVHFHDEEALEEVPVTCARERFYERILARDNHSVYHRIDFTVGKSSCRHLKGMPQGILTLAIDSDPHRKFMPSIIGEHSCERHKISETPYYCHSQFRQILPFLTLTQSTPAFLQ